MTQFLAGGYVQLPSQQKLLKKYPEKVKNLNCTASRNGEQQRRFHSINSGSFQGPVGRVPELQRRRHTPHHHQHSLQRAHRARHPRLPRRRRVTPWGRDRFKSARGHRGLCCFHRHHLPKLRVVAVVPRGTRENMRVPEAHTPRVLRSRPLGCSETDRTFSRTF